MIDLHSHILPGIDDGARTMADSVELARSAVRDGVTAMVATPHVRDDFPTTPATMERLVLAVRDVIDKAGVELEVLTGGEIALIPLMTLGTGELRRFSLAGTGRYVLVEFPYAGWPLPLPSEIERLGSLGMRCLIAHPERSAEVQEKPERLRPLVESGALVQLTAASVVGRLGRPSRRAAMRLLELELAHVISSDAHGPPARAAAMSGAAEAVGDPGMARWLTSEVPAAIVAGEGLPPRPARRRRWSLWG
jgi:protein-tyrosine phosphatase